jgi:hypothetical protein
MLLALSIFVLMSEGSAQVPGDVEDTLWTVVNQKITLPTNLPEIRTHAIKPVFEVDILAENLSWIRKGSYEETKGKVNKTTGSATYVYVIRESFPDTGIFYVRRTFGAGSETGKYVRETTYWKVHVGLPHLVNQISIPPTLYYSESRSINFATREYADALSYSYQIEAGGATLKGIGSHVSLDSLLNDVRTAANNTQVVVRGFYDGKPFRYRNPLNNRVDSTVWRVIVSPPNLEILTPWALEKNFNPGEQLFDMRQRFDFGPTQIRFVLTQKVGRSWLQVPLVPERLQISARVLEGGGTDQLVGGLLQTSQPFVAVPNRFWYIVELQPDGDFLASIPRDRFVNIELSIIGSDQFGRGINLKRRASIY